MSAMADYEIWLEETNRTDSDASRDAYARIRESERRTEAPRRTYQSMRYDCETYASRLQKLAYDVQLIHWRAAMDNYEPVPRVIMGGYAVKYSGTLTRRNDSGAVTFQAEYPTAGIVMPCDDSQGIPFQKAISSIAIFDYGDIIMPYYVASYNPYETELQRDNSLHMPNGPSVQWHEFPLSVGTRRDGRPVDMSSWMLGPRRAYHFKVTPLYLHSGNRWEVSQP